MDVPKKIKVQLQQAASKTKANNRVKEPKQTPQKPAGEIKKEHWPTENKRDTWRDDFSPGPHLVYSFLCSS